MFQNRNTVLARGYSYSCGCFVYGKLLPPDIKFLPRISVAGSHKYYVDPSTVKIFVGYDADGKPIFKKGNENVTAPC